MSYAPNDPDRHSQFTSRYHPDEYWRYRDRERRDVSTGPRDSRDRSNSPSRRRNEREWEPRRRPYDTYRPTASSPLRTGNSPIDRGRTPSITNNSLLGPSTSKNNSAVSSPTQSPLPQLPKTNKPSAIKEPIDPSIFAKEEFIRNNGRQPSTESNYWQPNNPKHWSQNLSGVTFEPETPTLPSISKPSTGTRNQSFPDSAQDPNLAVNTAMDAATRVLSPQSLQISQPTTTDHLFVETHGVPSVSPTLVTAPDTQSSIEALSEILMQHFEEATELASLKSEKLAAKKNVDVRDREFLKWKVNHEKYPAMKEAHTRNRETAKNTLASIEMKYHQKSATLKDITRQGVTRLIRSEFRSDGQESQRLQTEVDSLKQTTQRLESQLLEHQTYIEELKSKRQIVELENRKVQNEIAALRNSQNDMLTRLSEVQDDAANTSKILEALGVRTTAVEEMALQAQNTAVEEFLAVSRKLQIISDKVDIADQNHTQAKGNAAILEDVGQRLQKIELKERDINPIQNEIDLAQQAQLVEIVEAEQERLHLLVGRVVSLESTTTKLSDNFQNEIKVSRESRKDLHAKLSRLPSNSDLDDLRKKLTHVDVAALKVRIEAVEKQSQSLLESQVHSTPAQSINGRESSPGIEKRVADIEKQIRADRISPAESVNAHQTQQLKLNMAVLDNFENRLANLEKVSASHASIGSTGFVPGLEMEDVQTFVKGYVEATQEASALKMADLVDETISKVEELNKQTIGFRASLEELAYSADVDKAAFAPIASKLDNVVKKVDDQYNHLTAFNNHNQEQFEAVNLGIVNLRHRMDNIGTKDLAMHILSQMDAAYPNLRNAENAELRLRQHSATLDQHRISLQSFDARYEKLEAFRETLGPLLESPTATREEINTLKIVNVEIQQAAREANESVELLKKQLSSFGDDLVSLFDPVHSDLVDLKRWKEEQVKQSEPKSVESTVMSPVATDRVVSISNGASNNSVPQRSQLVSPARQASGEPSSKKQRSAQHLLATRPNGVYRNSSGKRKRDLGEGDTEDLDWEPRKDTISPDDM